MSRKRITPIGLNVWSINITFSGGTADFYYAEFRSWLEVYAFRPTTTTEQMRVIFPSAYSDPVYASQVQSASMSVAPNGQLFTSNVFYSFIKPIVTRDIELRRSGTGTSNLNFTLWFKYCK